MRRSSWVRFYLRRHVQAVEGDKTVSLLVNAETGNAPAEHHAPAPHVPVEVGATVLHGMGWGPGPGHGG